MQHMLTPDITPLARPITYKDGLLLIGSCFTEHMADRLAHHKFDVLQNPHGILFNPLSVARSLNSYIDGYEYTADGLFCLNELWNSWDHHTRFSHVQQAEALAGINDSQRRAAQFIRKAGCVLVTLGSAFQYYLTEDNRPVANNHRAPSQWLRKVLLSVAEITEALHDTIVRLQAANPQAQVIFTISPVRHIRDGVVDNNRSKARLIEAVHELCSRFAHVHYFPAYELVIDVLRDYRYYDIDLVHPNYAATSFVWEHFVPACIHEGEWPLMKQINDITVARNHRTRFPDTDAHRRFLATYLAKTQALAAQHPYLCFDDELAYFGVQ
jgi:lysophospholipase L1-like esterase